MERQLIISRICCAILAVLAGVYALWIRTHWHHKEVNYQVESDVGSLNGVVDAYDGVNFALLRLPVAPEFCKKHRGVHRLPEVRLSLQIVAKTRPPVSILWKVKDDHALVSRSFDTTGKARFTKPNKSNGVRHVCKCLRDGHLSDVSCSIVNFYSDGHVRMTASSSIELSNRWQLKGVPTLHLVDLEHNSYTWIMFWVLMALAVLFTGFSIFLWRVHVRLLTNTS